MAEPVHKPSTGKEHCIKGVENLVVFLAAALAFCPVAARATRRPGPSGARAVVTATLLTRPAASYPSCGASHVSAELRYRVIKVLEGSLTEKSFVGRHGCPVAQAFVKGARYRIELGSSGRPPSGKKIIWVQIV